MLLLLGIDRRHIPISHIPQKIHNDVKCKILLGNLDPQSDRASMVNWPGPYFITHETPEVFCSSDLVGNSYTAEEMLWLAAYHNDYSTDLYT